MMDIYKIVLKSQTAYGEYRHDVDIGYIFDFESKGTDYELILQKNNKYKDLYLKYMRDNRFDRNDILRGCMGTIPIKREVLFNCSLILYINNKEVADSFLQPYYALLLGRSEDLLTVTEKPKLISLSEPQIPFQFGKTIIPFETGKLIPGRLSKMNIEISEDYPRKVKRTGIFNIIDSIWPWKSTNLTDNIKIDSELKLGVYIHKGINNV
jgi:CRISPR-associated protein Cas5t